MATPRETVWSRPLPDSAEEVKAEIEHLAWFTVFLEETVAAAWERLDRLQQRLENDGGAR